MFVVGQWTTAGSDGRHDRKGEFDDEELVRDHGGCGVVL